MTEDLELFNVIAPFVKRGSFLEMRGEDSTWRWVFNGKVCYEDYPEIIWPELPKPPKPNLPWEKVNDLNMRGSHRVTTLYAPPCDIEKTFGEPSEKGGIEIDRSWYFKRGEEKIRLYAYQTTSTYNPNNPSPEAFWRQKEPFALSIAGYDTRSGEEFLKWALEKIFY